MHFFVDESGDPTFYDKYWKLILGNSGCSSILQLWFIKTNQPKYIRSEIATLSQRILIDPYYAWISSIEKKRAKFYFHAKDDVPEIRERFYRLIATLPFEACIVVARKKEAIFTSTHNAHPNTFYDAMVTHLFRYQPFENSSVIYFEKRWQKNRQLALEESIQESLQQRKHKTQSVDTVPNILVQTPTDEPCLQISDYINRAFQRAFLRKETRFFDLIKDKFEIIWDVYDTKNWPENYYTYDNPFDIKKISPIETR